MSAAPTCRYAGRDFTEVEIALIRDLIAEDPKLTRAHLSRAFCRRVGWVKPDGGLRDMMARCALLAMHRDGLIVLPPPRRPRHAPRPVVFGPESEPPLPPPPATIEAVRPLSLVPVLDRTSHNALLWKQFIARYHYLGYKPMAGAQMRYTVVDRHGASLAMIGMAAAAWKTAPRDHAIGWSPETRARNLHLVVNQSRLLLLPWIVIPNLGSHILSMLRRQLPGDWTQRYNPGLFTKIDERTRVVLLTHCPIYSNSSSLRRWGEMPWVNRVLTGFRLVTTGRLKLTAATRV